MRKTGFLFILLALISGPARAGELVMFNSPICEWCDIWEHDVGEVYGKTPESRLAPIRRVDIDDPRPADLKVLRGIVYTPTFVLMEGGREIGRITGYPGESHFWGLLGRLIERMEARVGACPQQRTAKAGTVAKRENPSC